MARRVCLVLLEEKWNQALFPEKIGRKETIGPQIVRDSQVQINFLSIR